jgi:GH24 family phage-related lysozyme (muramidase)
LEKETVSVTNGIDKPEYEYLADSSKDFVEAIKRVENNLHSAKRRGEYKQINGGEWRWFPGKSPEGGLPTLAWGHKLTSKEWSEKKIYFTDPTLNQRVFKDFRYGLTDAQVDAVLKDDLKIAEDLAKSDWNKYQPKPFEELPPKYKGVLVNLTFNAGALAKKGKFIWTTVARGILQGDDAVVTRGMVTSYKRPDGVRVKLTTRAVEIAKGLGLPWQILVEKP